MTMTAKNILVVCGTSVTTSTVVKEALKEKLPERGLDIRTIAKAEATEAPGRISSGNFDLIVTTTQLNEDKFDIPVTHTTAFMTGVGQDEVLDDIAATLEG